MKAQASAAPSGPSSKPDFGSPMKSKSNDAPKI